MNGGRTEAAAGNARGAAGGGASADNPTGVIQDWIESMGTEWMVCLRAAALMRAWNTSCAYYRLNASKAERPWGRRTRRDVKSW